MNKVSRTALSAVLAVIVSIIIGLGIPRLSFADELISSDTSDTSIPQGLSDEEFSKFTSAVKEVFTKYIIPTDDGFSVNSENLEKANLKDKTLIFEEAARALNFSRLSPIERRLYDGKPVVVEKFNAGTFGWCLVSNTIGLGAVSISWAALSAIGTAARAWKWGLAASTLLRAVGPAFARTFMKFYGGAVGIAIALAQAVVQCLWQQKW